MTEEQYRDAKAKRRTAYLIWCHDTPEQERKGIQVWEVAHWFFEDKITAIAEVSDEGDGTTIFSHPDKEIGRRILFRRDGTGRRNTAYSAHQFVPRKMSVPDKILNMSFPLDSVIDLRKSYKDIYEMFHEKEMQEIEEEPTEEDYENEGFDSTDTNPPEWGYEYENEEEEPEEEESEEDIPSFVCPAGGEFGVDFNQLEFCDSCSDEWDSCSMEAERLAEEKRAELERQREARKTKTNQPLRKSRVQSRTTQPPKRRPIVRRR